MSEFSYTPDMFQTEEYSYHLPDELIAQEAVHPHHDARLMVLSRETWDIIAESTFWDIVRFLPPDRILYFNNSRVHRARIRMKENRYKKMSGETWTINDWEILFTQKLSADTFEWLVRPGKRFTVGTKIYFEDGYVEVISLTENGRVFRCEGIDIDAIMAMHGELPLPPYIEYKKEKEKDYQTCFAQKEGSVAAPTASLHFTEELLAKIPHEKHFLTLHVWLGTFKGIDTVDVRDYQIHSEIVEIDLSLFRSIAKEKEAWKTILAIGTTSLRSLESLPHVWKKLSGGLDRYFEEQTNKFWETLSENINEPQVEDITIHWNILRFSTKIYIYPGVPFRVVDELITNFHLPESSLLLLVWAFMSKESILSVYSKAIEKQYRFFSFGDGMYIKKS